MCHEVIKPSTEQTDLSVSWGSAFSRLGRKVEGDLPRNSLRSPREGFWCSVPSPMRQGIVKSRSPISWDAWNTWHVSCKVKFCLVLGCSLTELFSICRSHRLLQSLSGWWVLWISQIGGLWQISEHSGFLSLSMRNLWVWSGPGW